jgi:Fe2+ transport system protein FeoA
VRLDQLEVGRPATLAEVGDHDPELLRYLAKLGLTPGRRLQVTEIPPFGGPIALETDGVTYRLGLELCRAIRVLELAVTGSG